MVRAVDGNSFNKPLTGLQQRVKQPKETKQAKAIEIPPDPVEEEWIAKSTDGKSIPWPTA